MPVSYIPFITYDMETMLLTVSSAKNYASHREPLILRCSESAQKITFERIPKKVEDVIAGIARLKWSLADILPETTN